MREIRNLNTRSGGDIQLHARNSNRTHRNLRWQEPIKMQIAVSIPMPINDSMREYIRTSTEFINDVRFDVFGLLGNVLPRHLLGTARTVSVFILFS